MNRVFQARIAWYQYFLLFVLGANAVGALWVKMALIALLFMLVLVVVIEQIVHTSYTITAEGTLVVCTGRFSKKKIIPLKDIRTIRRGHSMKFGRFSVTSYLLIEYGQGKVVSVMPKKEDEFIEYLKKKREHCQLKK